MGIRVHTRTVQDLDISGKTEYDSFELQNYIYTVSRPDLNHIPLKNPEWVNQEFFERICGIVMNPGNAWKLRKEYWERFIHDGQFSYTYSESLFYSLKLVINALRRDQMSRQLFIPIFQSHRDVFRLGKARIPCSLGYWLYFRQGRLHITYLQRSSDFFEHFNYDIWLAYKLLLYIAEEVTLPPGTFSHWVGSLHVFQKDVADVF